MLQHTTVWSMPSWCAQTYPTCGWQYPCPYPPMVYNANTGAPAGMPVPTPAPILTVKPGMSVPTPAAGTQSLAGEATTVAKKQPTVLKLPNAKLIFGDRQDDVLKTVDKDLPEITEVCDESDETTLAGTCSSGPSSCTSSDPDQNIASSELTPAGIPPPPSEPPQWPSPSCAPPSAPPPKDPSTPPEPSNTMSQASSSDVADSPRARGIKKLHDITGLPTDEASELLRSHGWDLEKALSAHIAGAAEKRKASSGAPPPPPQQRRPPSIRDAEAPDDTDQVPPPPPPPRRPTSTNTCVASESFSAVDSPVTVVDSQAKRPTVANGDAVCAYFYGEWLEAKIHCLLENGELEVIWDDGSVTALSESEIALRCKGMTSIDDAVVASFWGKWYPGKVRRHLSQDWLEISWDDGSVSDTPPEHVYLRMRQA